MEKLSTATTFFKHGLNARRVRRTGASLMWSHSCLIQSGTGKSMIYLLLLRLTKASRMKSVSYENSELCRSPCLTVSAAVPGLFATFLAGLDGQNWLFSDDPAVQTQKFSITMLSMEFAWAYKWIWLVLSLLLHKTEVRRGLSWTAINMQIGLQRTSSPPWLPLRCKAGSGRNYHCLESILSQSLLVPSELSSREFWGRTIFIYNVSGLLPLPNPRNSSLL